MCIRSLILKLRPVNEYAMAYYEYYNISNIL
jgi:hypothetical protein